jgi:hypothetical protein
MRIIHRRIALRPNSGDALNDAGRQAESIMRGSIWINLTGRERGVLLDALAAMRNPTADELAAKVRHARGHPKITIAVEGGLVQSASGNPFPIQICDYDAACDDDLPDMDDHGRRCSISIEPTDDQVR